MASNAILTASPTSTAAATTTTRETTPLTRRPYRGSCHCGLTRYLLLLPPFPPATSLTPSTATAPLTRFYKCNCTTCHKMGFFHVRVPDAPGSFFLLTPLDPESGGLRDYRCGEGNLRWFFCGSCGVRCFCLGGEGEVVAVGDVKGLRGVLDGLKDVDMEKDEVTRVWRCKREGWMESNVSYLSINALTVETGQEGFDLRGFVDNKWVAYLDCKDDKEEDRFDYPQAGGTW